MDFPDNVSLQVQAVKLILKPLEKKEKNDLIKFQASMREIVKTKLRRALRVRNIRLRALAKSINDFSL